LNLIASLVVKDFRRDWRRPWTILLFSALPLLMTTLMAAVFGGRDRSSALPALEVAIWDQDNDMLSRILRSMPSQGEAAQHLRLQFVESREEGVRLLEQRQASAFVVLPRNMTENLLNGITNSIELYENPAEQVMPKVARQGVLLLAAGLSGAAEILHEPLSEIRDWVRHEDFPPEAAVAGVASQSVKRLGRVRTYLFPPLIQFKTVAAADYSIAATNSPALTPTP
jgi:hypothetical protein